MGREGGGVLGFDVLSAQVSMSDWRMSGLDQIMEIVTAEITCFLPSPVHSTSLASHRPASQSSTLGITMLLAGPP